MQTLTQRTIDTIRNVHRTVRWTDWALSKIPLLLMIGCFQCVLHNATSPNTMLRLFLFVYVFAVSNAAFGFLINDLGDRHSDEICSKRNSFNQLGSGKAGAVLALVMVLMLASAAPFVSNLGFNVVYALTLCGTLAYSLPPFRLKERGGIGLVVSTLCQTSLPVWLLCLAMGVSTSLESFVWISFATIFGATLEVGHQRYDRAADLKSGTATFCAQHSEALINKVYSAISWLERITVGLVLALMWSAAAHSIVLKICAGFLVTVYGVSLCFSFQRLLAKRDADAWYGARPLDLRFIHNVIPNLLIPLCLLLHLSTCSPAWMLMLVWILAWRLLLYIS
jgi:hypothetical protein